MAEYVVIDKEQLESDLTVVADAIREKGGTTEQLAFPNGMADAVRGIQSGGVDHVRYATKVNFENLNLFQTPKISINLDSVNSLSYVFQAKVLNETVNEIEVFCNKEIPEIQNFVEAYSVSTNNALKKLTIHFDTSKCASFSGFAWKQMNLEEISGIPLDCTFSKSFNLWLSGCSALKEIRFKPNTIFANISFPSSDKLSAESIQSIIDGLATVETSCTLQFTSIVKAKLTEAQIATITSKNWTLA